MTLASAIKEALPPDDRMRIGVVLSTAPITVDIEGEGVATGCLSSYTPIVGDTVAVLRQDATWLILGRTVDSTSGESPQMQAGVVSMIIAIAASATTPVVFAKEFAAAPAVATNIDHGTGASSGWGSRAINVTTTGFTMFLFGSSSSFTANVYWQAQELTQ